MIDKEIRFSSLGSAGALFSKYHWIISVRLENIDENKKYFVIIHVSTLYIIFMFYNFDIYLLYIHYIF